MIIHWVGIGEVKSAVEGAQLGAILGSCVSVVLWQPEQRFAVMNHILLPRQGRHRKSEQADTRFAADSWHMMKERLAHRGISLNSCIAFVAGGGNVIDTLQGDIGMHNIECMLDLLETAAIPVHTANVGGTNHRTTRFNPVTGEFKVTQGRQPAMKLLRKPALTTRQAA